MAEGASKAGIARRIFDTESTVEKHVHSTLAKLDLPESDTEYRRVLAISRSSMPASTLVPGAAPLRKTAHYQAVARIRRCSPSS
jgi:DNA-binding NarL/FixJ family response regulator